MHLLLDDLPRPARGDCERGFGVMTIPKGEKYAAEPPSLTKASTNNISLASEP